MRKGNLIRINQAKVGRSYTHHYLVDDTIILGQFKKSKAK